MKSSEALDRAKTKRAGQSAIVDPFHGGRGPDGNILVDGISRQESREDYDRKVEMKRNNPDFWLEYDAESRSIIKSKP